MTMSAVRRLLVPVAPGASPLRWPTGERDAQLDYSLDFSACLADVGGDIIVSVSASAAPSGTGELQIERIDCGGALVTLWPSGGVSGRFYQVKVDAQSAAGRVFSVPVEFRLAAAVVSEPFPQPPSGGFGPASTWALAIPPPTPLLLIGAAAGWGGMPAFVPLPRLTQVLTIAAAGG